MSIVGRYSKIMIVRFINFHSIHSLNYRDQVGSPTFLIGLIVKKDSSHFINNKLLIYCTILIVNQA